MLGRILISLISTVRCFLRASAAFFCAWYLYLPKSRILHTGGSELGAISTRSRPASAARARPSVVATTPILWPVASISWIFGVSMASLMRGPPRSGASFVGRLTMFLLLLTNGGWRPLHKMAVFRAAVRLTRFDPSIATELRLTSQAGRGWINETFATARWRSARNGRQARCRAARHRRRASLAASHARCIARRRAPARGRRARRELPAQD